MDRQRLCPAKTYAAGLESFQTGSSIKCKVRNLIETPHESSCIILVYKVCRPHWSNQLLHHHPRSQY